MLITKRIIRVLFALGAMVMPVLAAGGDREPPGDLAVLIFLGFCALIIVAQLVPMARQILRRFSEQKVKLVEKTSEVSKD